MDPPCSNPARILPYWHEGAARPATNKGSSPRPGVHRVSVPQYLVRLRFELGFITFRRNQASPGARGHAFVRYGSSRIKKGPQWFRGSGHGTRSDESHEKLWQTRVRGNFGTMLTGRRLRQTPSTPYSFAAGASAGDGATSAASAAAVILLAPRRPELRAPAELFDSTKSAMRGTISARNREPLNTP